MAAHNCLCTHQLYSLMKVDHVELPWPCFQNGNRLPNRETQSINISGSGGLLTLAVRVRRGQVLVLTHGITHQDQTCHVVQAAKVSGDQFRVAVTFRYASVDFWATD